MSITTVMTEPAVSVGRRKQKLPQKNFDALEDEYWKSHGPQTVEELVSELDASRKRMSEGHYITEAQARELDRRLLVYIQKQRDISR